MKIFPKIASDFWLGATEGAPKKYFPKIFLREMGGGSKHVLGNFPYCEGVKYFRKKISPLDFGNFSKKKLHMGISTMAVKNVIFLKTFTEVKFSVIKVKGQGLNFLVNY